MLRVVDEYTRECLAIRVGYRLRSKEALEVLDQIARDRGLPDHIRSDNGSEFTCRRIHKWMTERGVDPIFIEPGHPLENGYVESFNGKLRDECLNEEILWSRAEAQVIVDWYRDVYNHERPHHSLGMKTPAEAASESGDHYAN